VINFHCPSARLCCRELCWWLGWGLSPALVRLCTSDGDRAHSPSPLGLRWTAGLCLCMPKVMACPVPGALAPIVQRGCSAGGGLRCPGTQGPWASLVTGGCRVQLLLQAPSPGLLSSPRRSFSDTDDPALAALCEKYYLSESTLPFDTCSDETTKQKSSITSEIVQCLQVVLLTPLAFALPSGLLLSQNRFPGRKIFH